MTKRAMAYREEGGWSYRLPNESGALPDGDPKAGLIRVLRVVDVDLTPEDIEFIAAEGGYYVAEWEGEQ